MTASTTHLPVETLLDELELLIRDAKAVPFTEGVRVPREQLQLLLDELREAAPVEVRQARGVVRERRQVLDDASGERERLLHDAHERAEWEASASAIAARAERLADGMLSEAVRDSRGVAAAVDDWADATLSLLEDNLETFRQAMRRGRGRLSDRRSSNESTRTVAGSPSG